jgi:hypothetical protein
MTAPPNDRIDMTDEPAPPHDAQQHDQLSQRAAALLARAYQLADSELEGIDEAAQELAAMTGDDLTVIDRARRLTIDRLAESPDRATKQVASLIRRALEVGMSRWHWDDSAEVP